MSVRKSEAAWEGTLMGGQGTMRLASGLYEGPYTYSSRFEEGSGTNPEELIGAAHAGCFSMFLAALLSDKGYKPERIETSASVHLAAGPVIHKIELITQAQVPGVGDEEFQDLAFEAKEACPVSKALACVPEITLSARLLN